MRKIINISSILLCAIFILSACEESSENTITIKAGIGLVGEELDYSNAEKYFNVGDQVAYEFEVTAPNGLNKIEFSEFEGVGINQKAPVILRKFEDMTQTTWVYSAVVENIGKDVRFSVYAQDNNREYKTQKISAMLNLTRYLDEIFLYDGIQAATSKTFCNIESGRTFFLAQTNSDPTNMDFGFAYQETNDQMKASLVSMDNYWATGVYPMVSNSLNRSVEFRKSTPVEGSIARHFTTCQSVVEAFDAATAYPAVGRFAEGKVASNLQPNEVVAFKTDYGRCGLIQITGIDRRSEATDNSQLIGFRIITENRYAPKLNQ